MRTLKPSFYGNGRERGLNRSDWRLRRTLQKDSALFFGLQKGVEVLLAMLDLLGKYGYFCCCCLAREGEWEGRE